MAPDAGGLTRHHNRSLAAARAGLADALCMKLGDGVADHLRHRRGEAGGGVQRGCASPVWGSVFEAVQQLVDDNADLLDLMAREAGFGQGQGREESVQDLLICGRAGAVFRESRHRVGPDEADAVNGFSWERRLGQSARRRSSPPGGRSIVHCNKAGGSLIRDRESNAGKRARGHPVDRRQFCGTAG
ncbi:hypothetical protein Emed_007222 [Eimeria media]